MGHVTVITPQNEFSTKLRNSLWFRGYFSPCVISTSSNRTVWNEGSKLRSIVCHKKLQNANNTAVTSSKLLRNKTPRL